jgi:hypothetical protein
MIPSFPSLQRALGRALLLLAVAAPLKALNMGIDATAGLPLAGPISPRVGPGFGASFHQELSPDWALGVAYIQHTFYEATHYISARAVGLRLRRCWDGDFSHRQWLELGVGYNPMGWHYANWHGLGQASAEMGVTWLGKGRVDWELGGGVIAFSAQPDSPQQDGLMLAVLRFGPRFNFF